MALFQQGWFALLVSLGESAPFIVLGLLLAGLMHEFVPSGALKRRLGGLGVTPVLRAVGLGALLPICSCSTIPIGLGMARSGAGTGTALAFMTSAPALSPVTVVLGVSLLGPALLGFYSVAVLIGACLIGLVGNSLLRARGERSKLETQAEHCGCGCDHEKVKTGKRMTSAVRWGLFDLGSEVSLSLLAGLVFATILLVLTPDEWVLSLLGRPGPTAVLTVILLSLPAYTCSVPALLIAGSLIAKGADPSVAVAFLIAGPATNLGELNAIRVGLGGRAAAYYFVAVVLLAVGVAGLIGILPLPNALSNPLQVAQSGYHGHRHLHFGETAVNAGAPGLVEQTVPTWRWPFICIVLALAFHAFHKQILKRRAQKQFTHATQDEKLSGSPLVIIEPHTNEACTG